MKYYLIAGEKSGDLHASNLMKALNKKDQHAEFRFFGGDEMSAVGGTLVKHYREMAFMGFVEVLLNANKIFENLSLCKKDIVEWKPDVVILIDYAGFNLKIAKFTRERGIKTFYYISPKIWAWNQKRALKIKAFVDKMFVILPFEEAFYQNFDYKVDFVGNPVVDAVKSFKPDLEFKTSLKAGNKKVIAILPGSRRQEIESNLKLMVGLARAFPNFLFVVAAVTDFSTEFFDFDASTNIKIVFGKTYDVLSNSDAAIVTSGTATLETALFKVPQVVCYKVNSISYIIAKSLIKVKYISLVNLLADKAVVKELIQGEFTIENMERELRLIIEDRVYRQTQIEEYDKIDAELSKYKASDRTAELITEYLAS